HIAIRGMFGGLFHTPQKTLFEGGGAKILDVGCGPGSWTLDMATTFPAASFVGADIVSYDHQNLPSNVVFQKENVLEGLSFPDNTFDLVYQRALLLAVQTHQWPGVIRELARVTKPGGYIQLVDVRHRLAALCTSTGLQDVEERVSMYPIGWNGPVGTLIAENMKQMFTGASRKLFMAGRDEGEYDQFVDAALQQAADERLFTKVFCVTARRLDSGLESSCRHCLHHEYARVPIHSVVIVPSNRGHSVGGYGDGEAEVETRAKNAGEVPFVINEVHTTEVAYVETLRRGGLGQCWLHETRKNAPASMVDVFLRKVIVTVVVPIGPDGDAFREFVPMQKRIEPHSDADGFAPSSVYVTAGPGMGVRRLLLFSDCLLVDVPCAADAERPAVAISGSRYSYGGWQRRRSFAETVADSVWDGGGGLLWQYTGSTWKGWRSWLEFRALGNSLTLASLPSAMPTPPPSLQSAPLSPPPCRRPTAASVTTLGSVVDVDQVYGLSLVALRLGVVNGLLPLL
ncbi:hypothetical protein HK405_003375, partial [Cladochytrium tenue]